MKGQPRVPCEFEVLLNKRRLVRCVREQISELLGYMPLQAILFLFFWNVGARISVSM